MFRTEVVRLDEARLPEFQVLYTDFFLELRKKQGWKAAKEAYFRQGDAIFLALEDGNAVGFIRLSSREGCFWVEDIYVRPEFRGRVIGRALVKRAGER